MSSHTPPTAELDHIVVAAHNLDQGCEYVRDRLGVVPTGGGKHVAMGTHNRVLKLGRDCYLEVIAIDPGAQSPDMPRWFNLDDPDVQEQLRSQPRLITWVVRTEAIDRLARDIFNDRLVVRPMRRDALRWRFAFSLDGSMPGDGLIPHLIQWDHPVHPAANMKASGCKIMHLEGLHVDPPPVRSVIASMGVDGAIAIHRATAQRPSGLAVHVATPKGRVLLD
jgi:hypothetical protein